MTLSSSTKQEKQPGTPQLGRGFGLLHATALNMANVVGIGPFITIPLILSAMGGPQALLGWILGAAVAMCDGQVWSELGAAWPGSGGSYRYLREAYSVLGLGQFMAFLFIWTYMLSGPLELASGLIGFAQYATYIAPGLVRPLYQSAVGRLTGADLLAGAIGVTVVALLYRRITFVGRLTVTLWMGTIATLLGVVVMGAPHFSLHLAFSFPAEAFSFSRGFFQGLGSAMLIAMYDYAGYSDVCYIGDEVRDPTRTIPRSILYCILMVAVGYLALEIIVIGVIPWKQAATSHFVVSDLMQQLYGRRVALLFTCMILWTAFASVVALMLGYSRIFFAAAQDGCFFKIFARVHPKKRIPHVSLLVLGAVTVACAFLKLEVVIAATMTTRILVQSVAQIFALPLLRRRLSERERPYRMWLYPAPAVIALIGWLYVFVTSGAKPIEAGLLMLTIGVAVYFGTARSRRQSQGEATAEGSAQLGAM